MWMQISICGMMKHVSTYFILFRMIILNQLIPSKVCFEKNQILWFSHNHINSVEL